MGELTGTDEFGEFYRKLKVLKDQHRSHGGDDVSVCVGNGVWVGCAVIHHGHTLQPSPLPRSSRQIEEPLQYEFMKMDEMRNNPPEDMQSELLHSSVNCHTRVLIKSPWGSPSGTNNTWGYLTCQILQLFNYSH